MAQLRNNNLLVDVEAATKNVAMSDRPWMIAVIGGLSVLGCCVFSQVIAASAKKSKLKLNKYYQRKKHEKD